MTKLLSILLLLTAQLAFAQQKSHTQMAAALTQVLDRHYVILDFTNDEKWHTYWKNPGDAGLPLQAEFKVQGEEIKFQELRSPAPKKYIEPGDILAYGYEGQYQLFFEVSAEQIEKLKGKKLEVLGKWLVCKDICIPGSQKIDLQLDNQAHGKSSNFKLNSAEQQRALQSLPKPVEWPSNVEIALVRVENEQRLAIQYIVSNLKIENFDSAANFLTPFPTVPLDFKHEKLSYDAQTQTLYGRIYADWDGAYQEPVMELPEDGNFKTPFSIQFLIQEKDQGRTDVVTAEFTQFALSGDKAFNQLLNQFSEPAKTSSVMVPVAGSNLALYLFFALIGGIILNLMPCVLPVISLKLFGLVSHNDGSTGKLFWHNLAYTLGVIFSFWVLAIAVIILKASGEKIGWGFQLQSPGFVFTMLIILLVMAMNMLGLFEFITPGGRILGNVQLKKNYGGDFMAGILATVLSTPCSAPFLGTALTFAFTTGTFNIFLILTFIGIGLALPFILIGLFPKLVSILPRPGVWMEKLKNFLGLTLLLTFIWLYDVLVQLIDFGIGGLYINAFFVALFFAFFFREKISKHPIWSPIFFLLPALILVAILSNKLLDPYTPPSTASAQAVTQQNWQKWTPEKLKELSGERKWVFMDFTAAWCLTCKANKKLVLNTSAFTEMAKKHDLQLLVGDWTKRDERITDFLMSYQVVGVPAYFVQKPNGQIVHLGETISVKKVENVIAAGE